MQSATPGINMRSTLRKSLLRQDVYTMEKCRVPRLEDMSCRFVEPYKNNRMNVEVFPATVIKT